VHNAIETPSIFERSGEPPADPLAAPSTGWVAFALAFWVWHAPALYDLALDYLWHHIEHACFLVSALLFWRPLILAWPAKVKMLRLIVDLSSGRVATEGHHA
jgi:cytochrome c oxidase assembly factor CtaG